MNEISEIFFITGNNNKFNEIASYLPQLRHAEIHDLTEIQSLDIKEIIEYKLLQAKLHFPSDKCILLVEDTGLYLDSLNNFPGPLIKFLLQSINCNGIYELCKKLDNYKAFTTTVFGLYDNLGKEIIYFSSTIKGEICYPIGDHGFGWDQIFVPFGANQSYAQMKDLQEKNKYSMRYNALQKIVEYIFNKKSLGT